MQLIFKELETNLKETKNNLLEVRYMMADVKRKFERAERMAKKAEEKAQRFAESIKEFSEEEKQTAQEVFDRVEPFRNIEGKDLNFQAAREDYNKTCELYEETIRRQVELGVEGKMLLVSIWKACRETELEGGEVPEVLYNQFTKWADDIHHIRKQLLGIEVALLNRKAASGVVFQDKIKRTFPDAEPKTLN